MPPGLREAGTFDIYQEPDISLELQNAISRVSLTKKQDLNIAIYAGKGIYNLNAHNSSMFSKLIDCSISRKCKIELITRFSPSNKIRLYDLLSMSDLLVCLDPFSNIEREALVVEFGSLILPKWKNTRYLLRNLSRFQLNEILDSSSSCKKQISDTYMQYSQILKRFSEAKMKTFMRAMKYDLSDVLNVALERAPRVPLSEKLIIKMTTKLQYQILNLKYQYSKCIHPMEII